MNRDHSYPQTTIHTWCLVRSTARRHAKDALMNWIEAAISAKLGFFQATGVRGDDTWPMNSSLNSSDIETIILGTRPSMLVQTIGYLFGGEPIPLLASSNVVNPIIVYIYIFNNYKMSLIIPKLTINGLELSSPNGRFINYRVHHINLDGIQVMISCQLSHWEDLILDPRSRVLRGEFWYFWNRRGLSLAVSVGGRNMGLETEMIDNSWWCMTSNWLVVQDSMYEACRFFQPLQFVAQRADWWRWVWGCKSIFNFPCQSQQT